MKKMSLQWRLTIITTLLIAMICGSLTIFIYKNGVYYIDSLQNTVDAKSEDNNEKNPDEIYISIPDEEWNNFAKNFSIQVYNNKADYKKRSLLFSTLLALLGGVATYFLSGHVLKPLRNFSDKIEEVQAQNLADSRIEENEVKEPSAYKDYEKTKAHVLQLKAYIEANAGEWVLTHIDAVPDNFLFVEENGKEEIRLIDWEYAGMQDPHVDIAMFCIYSLYKKEQVDHLIDLYFEGNCDDRTRIKIYCYIAVCGLLWSNWCEYKRKLGVEFGEYSLRQYRYAKDYYKIVQQELGEEGKEICTK